jgi:hypothetical protein
MSRVRATRNIAARQYRRIRRGHRRIPAHHLLVAKAAGMIGLLDRAGTDRRDPPGRNAVAAVVKDGEGHCDAKVLG